MKPKRPGALAGLIDLGKSESADKIFQLSELINIWKRAIVLQSIWLVWLPEFSSIESEMDNRFLKKRMRLKMEMHDRLLCDHWCAVTSAALACRSSHCHASPRRRTSFWSGGTESACARCFIFCMLSLLPKHSVTAELAKGDLAPELVPIWLRYST